ncbi:MAG: polyphosphate polymerase domain-containing protein [Verrucomicrobia bacterium]|nr:polyphosphate polymerase domain-containing protein [Verrucomicrobiota bacterium]
MQRWELKYIVPEYVAQSIRLHIGSYLDLDDYGKGKPHNSYLINSLYLDSDALSLYWHTINGNKNRFKLRLRFYDNDPESPVYFEIKRRMNDAILKQRGGVRRKAVDYVLDGHLPKPEHLLKLNNAKELVALQRFSATMKRYRAKPKALVQYLREAWVSPNDNSLRVTFDRQVLISPEQTTRLEPVPIDPKCVFGKEVIVELKFTGRFPDWLREMVRIFGLTRTTAAKYADGIALVGEREFLGSYSFIKLADPEQEEEAGENVAMPENTELIPKTNA